LNNRYKLLYLILGIGIGIVLTNTIYIFNPKTKHIDYTDQEIIEKAREMGMVKIKDNIDTTKDEISTNELKEDKIEVSIKTEEETNKSDEKEEKIKFVINYGDTLMGIAKNLLDAGIIDDENEFIQLAKENKLNSKFRTGTYYIKPNTNYSDIMKMLTTKQ
jgi:hypothetical protein